MVEVVAMYEAEEEEGVVFTQSIFQMKNQPTSGLLINNSLLAKTIIIVIAKDKLSLQMGYVI